MNKASLKLFLNEDAIGNELAWILLEQFNGLLEKVTVILANQEVILEHPEHLLEQQGTILANPHFIRTNKIILEHL
ncbi:MAG: phosphomannomutase [Solibacillus isronensis]